MELIAVIIAATSFLAFARKSKKHTAEKETPVSDTDEAIAERQRKLQEIDEHITVVLPIIRDK